MVSGCDDFEVAGKYQGVLILLLVEYGVGYTDGCRTM